MNFLFTRLTQDELPALWAHHHRSSLLAPLTHFLACFLAHRNYQLSYSKPYRKYAANLVRRWRKRRSRHRRPLPAFLGLIVSVVSAHSRPGNVFHFREEGLSSLKHKLIYLVLLWPEELALALGSLRNGFLENRRELARIKCGVHAAVNSFFPDHSV